ncbi:hydrolase [Thermoactinomyces mirandus]|uniref:Hydrolase n=1 Tax=Thermoactinomyces mirandus TaxID=2756294 RepID=A0A7W1XUR4_9BACL|nr:hydrolase [Thermoactinomyces mirandus]MBA4603568.1 hydrolase [Thermoactinomyces mirandus]
MKKKTYYVSIDFGTQAGEIRTEKDEHSALFEYEIEATQEEIARLEKLFTEVGETDFSTFAKAHVPFLDNESTENLQEDDQIRKIYRMIYQLGSGETKSKLREAGIIH